MRARTTLALAALLLVSCGGDSLPDCPCEVWRWHPPRTDLVPVPTFDGEGNLGVTITTVHTPGRWECGRRYPRLPEGGCGHLGQEPATRDAPRAGR